MIYLKKSQNRQEEFSKNRNGSITIFLALTLVLILSFLFSMVEAARVNGLGELAKRKLVLETQSLFGAYNQELWEHYGLLFLDMSYGTGEPDVRLMEEHLMEEDYGEGNERHFYQMALKDAQVEAYALATDREGAEFRRQACEAAKNQLVQSEIKNLESKIAVWNELESEGGDLEEKWEEALTAEEEAKKYAEDEEAVSKIQETEENGEEVEAGEIEEKETEESLPENPVGYVAQLKNASLLAVVMEESSELSTKSIDTSTGLDNRELFCGNMAVEQGNDVDKLWFVQYLNQYFSCKTDSKEQEHVLDYELEYCIGGKDTDAQNLEVVAKKLLQIRESANFVTIMQDSQKQSIAMKMAVAAVGFTGLAPLIKAVQLGILLAWCYIESILDLRCLLSGGKVQLIKDSSQWKSDLFHIQEVVSQSDYAETEKGMDYKEYLQMLLYTTGERQLTYRAMNVVERNIRLFSGNEAMRMDTMVSAVRVQAVYSAKPLFLNVIPRLQKIDGNYYFCETRKIAY